MVKMERMQRIFEKDKGKRIVEKGKKGIFYILFGRTGIIAMLLLVQLALLFLLFGKLQDYMIYVYGSFYVLSVVTAVLIVNRRGNDGYKLAWMIPITFAPVFGCLFYLFMDMQIEGKVVNMLLDKRTKKIKHYMEQSEEICAQLEQKDMQMRNLSRYIWERGNYPTYTGTKVTYFPLGEDKFEALVRELKQAKQFIFLEYFIVAEGRMWNTILEILKERAGAGVDVRLMYDGGCTLRLLPHGYEKELRSYGIKCQVFNPIKPVLSSMQNNRDHRKIAVIDGHTAFTGGINLADEYINEKLRFGHWKDTAIMLQGNAAKSFTWMFLQMWNERSVDYDRFLRVDIPEKFTKQEGYVIPYSDSPLDHESMGELVYMDVLNTAKKYVHIMTPYLIPDENMITAFTYAAKRGIDVKIIMPSIPDKKYAFALAKTYYMELLQAGVEIYQYIPGFVHAKTFVSDDEKAVVGTINVDYRSLYLHFECAAMLYRVDAITDIEQDFQKTLLSCKKITVEDCKKEKIVTKICGKLLRLIAPLM